MRANLYGTLYRRVLFPVFEGAIKRRPTCRYYRDLSRQQDLTPDALRDLQRAKLNALLRHCRDTVPFYRDLFARAGLDVGRVFDLEPLRQYGVAISKEDVRSAGPALISTRYEARRLLPNETSGSTGAPAVFYSDPDGQCLRVATKIRAEEWIGKPLGTPTTLVWGHRGKRGLLRRLKQAAHWRFQNYQFFSAYDVGEENLVRTLGAMKSFRTRFLECYVTAAYLMAKVVVKYRLTPPRLDGVVIGGEQLADVQKTVIEGAFGCPVYNRYGSSEFMNVACECRRREGLHVNADNLLVEVLDTAGRPVVDEPGDLVITDLNNFAHPLVRYAIGDRAVLSSRRCGCGRVFPLLERLAGRRSERLRMADGRDIHDMFFVWELSLAPGLRKFQVVQKTLTAVEVNLETDGGVPREQTSRFVLDKLDGLRARGVDVRLNYVDAVPLTRAGKWRTFLSELDTPEPQLTPEVSP